MIPVPRDPVTPSRRALASLGGRQLHYRIAGDGPPVLLLGNVPTCVRADDPLLAALARRHWVLAVDPPGHGFSDAPQPGAGISPFLDPLARFAASLECGPVMVVGAGVGATLALALLDAHPDLIARVLVHNPVEPGDLDGGWTPPAIDGTHLLSQWDRIVRADLFRPSDSTRYVDRVMADLPSPEQHHARFIDGLRAGAQGERLRRALSEFDSARVRVRHGSRIAALDFGGDGALSNPDDGRRARLPPCGPSGDGFGKYLIDVDGGQLFARGDLRPGGALLLGLHDQAGASARLDQFVGPFLGRRSVLSIDMPGSGGSDAILAPEAVSIEAYAGIVEAALMAVGADAVDAVGRYSGGQTAVELAMRRPDLVRHVVNAGVMIFDDADRAEHLAHYAPSIAPVWDGSHLVTAWMAFRSQNLWWPWYDRRAASIIRRDARLDPQLLHDRIVDALAAGPFYRAAYHASFEYPMAARLRALAVPCLLTDIAGTASHRRLAQAKAAAPACATADLDEDPTTWPALFGNFFADA